MHHWPNPMLTIGETIYIIADAYDSSTFYVPKDQIVAIESSPSGLNIFLAGGNNISIYSDNASSNEIVLQIVSDKGWT